MNMKRLYIPTLIAFLFVAGAATAGDKPAASAASADQHVLPVLVKVNAKGKVTEATPATTLQPDLQGLLERTLGKMITKPAHDAKGNPIASQFIIKLAMNTAHRNDGQLNVSFSYVSAKPVPPGNWYWTHIEQPHRLVLMNRNNGNQIGRYLRAKRLEQAYAHMSPGSGN